MWTFRSADGRTVYKVTNDSELSHYQIREIAERTNILAQRPGLLGQVIVPVRVVEIEGGVRIDQDFIEGQSLADYRGPARVELLRQFREATVEAARVLGNSRIVDDGEGSEVNAIVQQTPNGPRLRIFDLVLPED